MKRSCPAPACVCLTALAVALAAGLPGCASRAPREGASPVRPAARQDSPVAAEPAFGAAYQSLVAASRRAAAPAADAAPPTALPAEAVAPVAPGTDAHARAIEPTETVVGRLANAASPPAASPRPTDETDRIAALRLYASGRERLMRGDLRGAAEDLTAATHADPSAPRPWRELGEAHAAMGSLLEAESAFQAAVDRGLRDARCFEFLARSALTAGDAEGAAGLFALALDEDAENADPALPLIIAHGLGGALLQAGYLHAGCAVLARALDLPERPPSPTRYANELGAIYRRQGDAWRSIGDANARLGRYEDSLGAYQRAATLPAMDAQDISARILHAARRAGRPAAAAVFVLDRIRAAGGRASREDAAVLRGLANDPAIGRLTARALDEFASSLGPGAPPSVLGGLARARAAALSPLDATAVLRQHLRRWPADATSAAELLQSTPDGVVEAARLTAGAPAYADRYADALARTVTDAPAALAALSDRRDAASRLLAVFLSARTQGNAEAWSRASGLSAPGAIGIEAECARARIAAALGRWADAEHALKRLSAAPVSPASARARARALWASRRAEEALEALRPALDNANASPSERLDDILLAAELAMRLARADVADRWVREAAAIDPGDDRPYALMLALHGPTGPMPDADRLGEGLRDLRAASPDSRLLAFIRAQEFIRRGFFSQAEQELKRLAAPDPTDPAVVELLCAVWTRPGQSAETTELNAALRYLDEQYAARPWSDVLLSARARVLAAAGRGDQAEAGLKERLAAGGSPELSRLLENLLRRRGEADEADRLALERLSARERSIDESLEWIELLAAQGRDDEVAPALRDGLPSWVVLDASQADRVQIAVASVVARAGRPDAPRGPALGALDEAIRRRIRLSAELHDQRLALLAADPGADADRLITAADDAARDHPALGSAAYLRLAQAMVAADRGDAAIALMERAGARPDASVDVIEAWVLVLRSSGTAEQVRRAVDRATALGRMKALMERLMPARPNDETPSWDPRSMLAYELALIRASEDHEDESIALYELALEYDPRHGWANNNLGYHLVERGEDLDRAERLLEAAIEALPEEASVIDSLGWLRYRLGAITDTTDESGRVVRQGAVRLLERAVRADQDRTRRSSRGWSNQTILDHYGDALWAAGQKAEARRTWERAERAANRGASEIRTTNPPGGERLLREINQVRESAQRKIQAVMRGEEPPVAPRATAAAEAPGG